MAEHYSGDTPPGVILASGSPRRRELLRLLVPDYRVLTSDIEESGQEPGQPPHLADLHLPPPFTLTQDNDPRLWAWHKAADVIASHSLKESTGCVILAADTTVVSSEGVLNKPVDEADAAQMLSTLRGTAHLVVTGYVALRSHSGGTGIIGSVTSQVEMRDYSEAQIRAYVATGEPTDKAGAYAVQGLGGSLVREVRGCYYTVVGLPMCAVRSALQSLGVALLPYPQDGYCAYCPMASSRSGGWQEETVALK